MKFLKIPDDAFRNYRCQLGEGLFPHKAVVAWLDIEADQIYLKDRQGERQFHLPVQATAILDCIDDELTLLSAEGLGTFSIATGRYSSVEVFRQTFCEGDRRTNDGCRLSSGIILFGTMHNFSPSEVFGAVFMVCGGEVHELTDTIYIPNLFVEMPDGAVLIADSHRGAIFKCWLDAKGKQLDMALWYQAEPGVSPEGGCLLPDGPIAVAMWNAACIPGFDPERELSWELPPSRKPTH